MPSFRYYAIVPDGVVERVLLVNSGGRWTLPYFEPDRRVLWQAVDRVTREMGQRLDLTTLRCVGIYTHPELAPSIVGRCAALRDAYLRPWTKFEPMNRLIEAFELSTGHPATLR